MRLGHYTISFETANRSRHSSQAFKPGTLIAGSDEHRHGRSLLTPDEIMGLGPARPIVMVAGEPPYLLDRLDYRSDPPAPAATIPTRCTSPPRHNERGYHCCLHHQHPKPGPVSPWKPPWIWRQGVPIERIVR